MIDVEDAEILRSTAREIVTRGCNLDQAAALGWTGLFTAEDAGGEGWHPLEAVLIAIESGRAASASSWTTTAIAAGIVSSIPGHAAPAVGLLDGSRLGVVSVTHLESLIADNGGVSGATGRMLAEREPDVVVLLDRRVDQALVFLAGDAGVELDEDTSGLETIRLVYRARLESASAIKLVGDQVARLRIASLLLSVADTVGAVQAAVELVSSYLSDRVAYGAAIASFQAVQHRLVDLTVFELAADALVRRAARALAEGDPDAERLAAAAHTFTEARAVEAIDDCIQLAGGIGFTWEFPLHHLLRRASTNAALFGSGRASRDRLARLGGW